MTGCGDATTPAGLSDRANMEDRKTAAKERRGWGRVGGEGG